jgi:radical SAM protein with 4Fe4S-binding SPASM domain
MKFDPDPEFLAASSPKVFWVELTSRCSLDCIFCSRKLKWGTGSDMDFGLYRTLLAGMKEPEVIRLDYSGESVLYPHLAEAIQLARSTGAQVELVSALSPISMRALADLAESGLDRLTISLHSLNDAQYREIYRSGSLSQLRTILLELLKIRDTKGSEVPKVDFAFVAMRRNLSEIFRLAELAREIGVREIFVLPVFRRDPIPEQFSEELDNGRISETFKHELLSIYGKARRQWPEISIVICNPDVWPVANLGNDPVYYPAPLPKGARIRTCDQSPWDTMHILSNGDVVPCEVLDHQPLGNLNVASLQSIWNGDRYRAFRRDYQTGEIDACRGCPWKMAYIPGPLDSSIVAGKGLNSQLVHGWYPRDDSETTWSKRQARAFLMRGERELLHIEGILPFAPEGNCNTLEISANGQCVGEICNPGRQMLHFNAYFGPVPAFPAVNIELTTRFSFSPPRTGINSDRRKLGFALTRLEMVD